jgi:hypothetical protein
MGSSMTKRTIIVGILVTAITIPAHAEEWSYTFKLGDVAEMTDRYTVDGTHLLGAVNDYTGKRDVYEIVRNSRDVLVAVNFSSLTNKKTRMRYVMVDKRTGNFKLGASDSDSSGEETYLGLCSR